MAAYCMGSLNSDCWYMYTMKDFARPITSEPDQTIEILMSDLDTDIMDIFHQHTSSSAKEAREVIITSPISRYSVLCNTSLSHSYRNPELTSLYPI